MSITTRERWLERSYTIELPLSAGAGDCHYSLPINVNAREICAVANMHDAFTTEWMHIRTFPDRRTANYWRQYGRLPGN